MNAITENAGQTPKDGKAILSISIKEVSVLHASYMPFVENGGLFIPTEKPYEIGDEVFILLTLLDEVEQVPLAGTVIWITPKKAHNKRAAGIGVQFNDKDNEVKSRIENYLTGRLGSDKPTHTI